MDTADQWPPHKAAFSELESRELIFYGSQITWDLLTDLINLGDRDDWRFRGEYLELCQKLKEEGFMATERGMNGTGIRLLTREEMAGAVKRREHAKANSSIRNSIMLSQVPRGGLPEERAKALDHWEAKSALVGATTKMLLRRRSLPSPEMQIKSINQIK